MSGPWGESTFPALTPLGQVAEIQLGKMLQPRAVSNRDVLVPYLRAGLLSELGNCNVFPEMYASPADLQRFQVKPGDLLVAEGGDCGQVAFVPPVAQITIIQNSLHRVRSNVGERRFIKYCLESIHGSGWLEVLCSKSTFGHLTREKLSGLHIPFPRLSQQRLIADYLDREIQRIDVLMNQKKRLVGLLEERWAAIRHKLTGFDDLAERWPSVQLRRVAKLQAGAAFPHEDQGDHSGTIPYVKVSDLGKVDREGRIQEVSNRVVPDVAKRLRSPILSPETIVLPKIGAALLGNARALLSEPSCLDQNVMGVTVHSGDPRFVYHSLGSIDLAEFSTPGPVPLLNEDAALSVRIPWPSIETQREIAATLDEYGAGTLAPVRVALRQMTLLQERRQALITAAVTGQLDIPEAA